MSPVTTVSWSSTRSRRSPGTGSSWGIWKARYSCARCSPGGLATYWTRDLEEHLVAALAEWPKQSLLIRCKL